MVAAFSHSWSDPKRARRMKAKSLKNRIEKDRLPTHIAIIMDGNGRWARNRGLSRAAGHRAGADSVRAVVEGCRELGVKVLTLYAFSTENWNRPKREIDTLWSLLRRYVRKEIDNIDKEGIRCRAIGRMHELPQDVQEEVAKAERRTRDNTDMILNVALNYGGQQEIADAARRIAADVKTGNLAIDDIDRKLFAKYLYAPDLPEVDLLIRPGGERRISNFLLWELSYAELVMTDTLWPDFGKEELYQAIVEFQKRERRFGAVGEKRTPR
jgi:undecaprenyl diphosphate synthase